MTIGRLTSQSSIRSSDVLIAPKIHPNGIPIYDGCNTSSQYQIANKLATTIVPVGLVFCSSQPLLSAFSYSLLFYVYYVRLIIILDHSS